MTPFVIKLVSEVYGLFRRVSFSEEMTEQSPHSDYVTRCYFTAITSRVATLISASSKDHVMCLVFCMYSTLYSVQYGEILFS